MVRDLMNKWTIWAVALIIALIVCGGFVAYRTLRSKPLCAKPRLLRHFLSHEECDELMQYVEDASCLERSEVKEEQSVKSASRTSSTCFVRDDQTTAAASFRTKVEALTGIPKKYFEDAQVVKYLPGQKYDAHYDVNADDPQKEIRQLTVLVYLNDDFEGGETEFPKARTKVKPEKGMAVVWENVDTNGKILPCALHTALPVLSGTKYACTVWIRGFGEANKNVG